jgi:hypothetical protein
VNQLAALPAADGPSGAITGRAESARMSKGEAAESLDGHDLQPILARSEPANDRMNMPWTTHYFR